MIKSFTLILILLISSCCKKTTIITTQSKQTIELKKVECNLTKLEEKSKKCQYNKKTQECFSEEELKNILINLNCIEMKLEEKNIHIQALKNGK